MTTSKPTIVKHSIAMSKPILNSIIYESDLIIELRYGNSERVFFKKSANEWHYINEGMSMPSFKDSVKKSYWYNKSELSDMTNGYVSECPKSDIRWRIIHDIVERPGTTVFVCVEFETNTISAYIDNMLLPNVKIPNKKKEDAEFLKMFYPINMKAIGKYVENYNNHHNVTLSMTDVNTKYLTLSRAGVLCFEEDVA